MPSEYRLFKHSDLFIDFFEVLSLEFAVEFTDPSLQIMA